MRRVGRGGMNGVVEEDSVGRPSAFAALRVTNYRLWASGQLVSLMGTWMQRIAQDWLVLTLSGGHVLALGTVAALQFGPALLLSVCGGVIADRYDKRLLLILAQLASAACALVLGLLDLSGEVLLWHVFALALALGCVSALETPIRQSFVIDMVGRARLGNAVAVNSMIFNTSAMVGPAIAGVLITLIGTGWVFLVNVASYALVLAGLLAMDTTALRRPQAGPSAGGQVREGIAYVWRCPDSRVLLALVFMVAVSWLNFPFLLAVLSRNVLDRGADTYGLLSALLGAGALSGAVFIARRTGMPQMRLLLVSAAAFGALQVAVGLAPGYTLAGLSLFFVGAAALVFTTAAMSRVQLSAPTDVRGRVMGIYTLCFLGGAPAGGPLLGWIADQFGGRASFLLGGCMTLVAVWVGTVYLLRHHQLRASYPRRNSARKTRCHRRTGFP
jgi:MFS family permease